MSVTKEDVKKIAELARLEFNEEEISNYTNEMNKILGYVEKLGELDTENVEPLSRCYGMGGPNLVGYRILRGGL